MGKERLPGKQGSKQSLSQEDKRELMLHNDDYHTFPYVIDALIEICDYTTEQAEQIAHITHYKGKCPVKSGSYEKLKPFRDGLYAKELSVTIE